MGGVEREGARTVLPGRLARVELVLGLLDVMPRRMFVSTCTALQIRRPREIVLTKECA